MRGAWIAAGVTALLLHVAVAPGAAPDPELVDVRVGHHPAYDRVVLVFDREAELLAEPDWSGERLLVEIGARREAGQPDLPTRVQRITRIRLDSTDSGMRVRIFGTGQVRAFRLHDPPRVVLDFGDAGGEPLEVPAWAEAIPLRSPDRAGVAPPPGPPEATSPAPAGASPTPTPSPTPAQSPPPVSPAPGTDAPPPGGVPPPAPDELPMPPPALDDFAPAPSIYDPWMAVLIWVGGPLLLAGLGLYLTRRRWSSRDYDEGEVEEGLAAEERLDLLERRIDEEVRERMALEQRMGEFQEDLKVVRDRVTRLTRRGAS